MKRIPAQQGSILVELLVVLVIISVVMVGMVTSFGNISRGQVRADKRLEATQYAIEGIEVVYNYGRNSDKAGDWVNVVTLAAENFLSIDRDAVDFDSILYGDITTQDIDNTFERHLTIFDEYGDGSLLRVTSTVCWENIACVNGVNETTSVEFETYFAKLEP